MKQSFSFMVLTLITLMTLNAQKEKKFSKVFEVNKSTTMLINLDNSNIIIEPSTDGKVHINSNYAFDGYSKKEIIKELKSKTIEANFNESSNHITLTANQIKRKNNMSYAYDGEMSLFLEGDLFGFNDKKKNTIVRKSKDSILREIVSKYIEDVGFLRNRIKVKDKDGKVRNIGTRNTRISMNKFVVKIPPYVKLNISGKKSKINIYEDIINELNVNLKEGSFRGKSLINSNNKFKIKDATFRVESILGGDYTFNNLNRSKIGTLQQVNITSSFSKIEIGEIQKEVKLTDFGSRYWFYNFSKDFERFEMFSEYSIIHNFLPETDYSMRVFGYNTIMDTGENRIRMKRKKNKKKYIMFDFKRKNEGFYGGHINLDIIHSVIYTYNDTLTPKTN